MNWSMPCVLFANRGTVHTCVCVFLLGGSQPSPLGFNYVLVFSGSVHLIRKFKTSSQRISLETAQPYMVGKSLDHFGAPPRLLKPY